MNKYSHIYDLARQIKQGKKIPPDNNLSCFNCFKRNANSQRCSGCQAVYYCDKSCQKMDWSDRRVAQGTQAGHKQHCASMKEQMRLLPEIDAILYQFPWSRVDMSGPFRVNIFLAMLDLLGDDHHKYGWWASVMEGGASEENFGRTLLHTSHLTDTAGWRLPADQIPYLDFNNTKASKPAKFPPDFEDSWVSYYKWRTLPLESPAALLLHWPLSVYILLKLLGVAPPTGQIPQSRQKITVHYIGAEKELDILPVFGELALLLPNTELEMIIFSSRAHQLSTKHGKSQALVSKPLVYSYDAPEDLGSGALRISLAKTGPYWEPASLTTYTKPDALIGLNAGVSTYEEWRDVFVASRVWPIPFAVTDYGIQSLDDDKLNFQQIISFFPMMVEKRAAFGVDGIAKLVASKDDPTPGAINPFQRPGDRTVGGTRLPSAMNGFTSVITAKNP